MEINSIKQEENKQDEGTTITFESLGVSKKILRAVADMGFEEPTSIQQHSIKIMNSGHDVIGQSQTGTGKTAAFGIPCIERIDASDKSLQCVVLCPTRELAIQICDEMSRLLKYTLNIRVLPIYGGQPIDRQIFAMKRGVQIVVGTPGRVMDHMRRRTIKMETVKIVVLDEADEMLDMGFREDIETILKDTPTERQTMLYSATLSKEIMDLSRKFTVNPEIIKVTPKQLTVSNVQQIYFDIKEHAKAEATCRLLDMYSPELAIIFCNTKRRVDLVVEQLQARGHFAEGLHGDLRQTQRDKVMQGFRFGTTKILVATDVAARGIDVDNVDFVINYDLPQDDEYYVHRIGRTGRAGRFGKAYSFVVGKEIFKLRDIMRYTKSDIVKEKLPSIVDIENATTQTFIENLTQTIDNSELNRYMKIVDNIVADGRSVEHIAAALIKMELESKFDKKKFSEDVDFEPATFRSYDRSPRSSGRNRFTDSSRSSGLRRNTKSSANMVKLSVNVGKRNHIRPQDIVGAIAGETGISGRAIGSIDIFDTHTFVDIPKEHAGNVVKIMSNNTIKGYKVTIEKAATQKRVRSFK